MLFTEHGAGHASEADQIPTSVSLVAVIARINRRLLRDDKMLRRSRGKRMCGVVGEFYTMDITHKAILEKDVDVEALARKVGALKDRETVAEA